MLRESKGLSANVDEHWALPISYAADEGTVCKGAVMQSYFLALQANVVGALSRGQFHFRNDRIGLLAFGATTKQLIDEATCLSFSLLFFQLLLNILSEPPFLFGCSRLVHKHTIVSEPYPLVFFGEANANAVPIIAR